MRSVYLSRCLHLYSLLTSHRVHESVYLDNMSVLRSRRHELHVLVRDVAMHSYAFRGSQPLLRSAHSVDVLLDTRVFTRTHSSCRRLSRTLQSQSSHHLGSNKSSWSSGFFSDRTLFWWLLQCHFLREYCKLLETYPNPPLIYLRYHAYKYLSVWMQVPAVSARCSVTHSPNNLS